MIEIKVKTSNRNYNILIKRNIADVFNNILNSYFKTIKKIFFISNEKIFLLHGKEFLEQIKNEFNMVYLLLKDGEEYKNQNTLSEI